MKLVVSDSSTLIVLLDTGYFSLLFELFESLCIVDEVMEEITAKYNHRTVIEKYIAQGAIRRCALLPDDPLRAMLRLRLDPGEAAAIALAKTRGLPLIIDERSGRKIAREQGVPIIGLIGILLKMMEKNILSKPEALRILDGAEENNFYLADALKDMVRGYQG